MSQLHSTSEFKPIFMWNAQMSSQLDMTMSSSHKTYLVAKLVQVIMILPVETCWGIPEMDVLIMLWIYCLEITVLVSKGWSPASLYKQFTLVCLRIQQNMSNFYPIKCSNYLPAPFFPTVNMQLLEHVCQ